MKAAASTKTELARKYKVHYNTFTKWLKLIPDLKLNPRQRILTPKQVSMIYDHLGEP
jgi:hypothetical protein